MPWSLFGRLPLMLASVFLILPPIIAFAQTPPSAEAPAFMKDLKSEADFANLSPEQKAEFEAFLKNNQPSLMSLQEPAPEGTVSCFDNYHFGSVQVDVSPSVSSTVPGIPVTFSGTIKNQNSYPVIAGSVYAKVFRKQSDPSLVQQNGHLLVDQFVVKSDVTLGAEGEDAISFDWNIPSSAPAGDYEVALFFYTADRFNLLGLTFTDDVVGNKASFSVKSENQGEVAFDKNAVTLNGNQYRFAAFPPRFTKDESVKTEVKLKNTTGKDQVAAVSWKLYNWDALRKENFIEEKRETISLRSGETKTLSYATTKEKGAVSFLVVEAVTNGQKSLLDIRFVRDGVSETRINFPGIASFPLVKGQPNAVFACAHSTNLPLVPNSELALTLKDNAGNIIHDYTYKGGITGSMMGLKDAFTPKQTYDTFTLTTTLKKDGKVVESLDLNYDCSRIDPTLCQDRQGGIMGNKAQGVLGEGGSGVLLTILLVIVILLGLLAWKLLSDRKKHNRRPPLFPAFFFALLLSSAFFFGAPERTEAKSVTSNVNGIPQLAYDWEFNDVYTTDSVSLDTQAWGAKWLSGLEEGASASVGYSATLIDNNLGYVINDGSSVPIGTVIRVERQSARNTDISWNGTGVAYDTPFGYWIEGAGPQPRACHAEDQTYSQSRIYNEVEATIAAYTLLDVNPTVEQIISPSANLSCVGNLCTVTGAGPVSIGMKFPQTYGRFYYRYLDHPEHYGGGCRANNTPMRVCEGFCGPHGGPVQPDSYDLPIPEATITWSLMAVPAGNTAPLVPVIIPQVSNSSAAGAAQSFDIQASDPDNDTLRYGIDWNNDSSLDQWIPGSGFVASNTVQTASYSWMTGGSYTFQVLAQDENGASSAWVSHAVVINDPVAVSNTLQLCTQSGIPLATAPSTISRVLMEGRTETLNVFYDNDALSCNGTPLGDASWTEDSSNAAVSIAGPNASPQVVTGNSSGTEQVTVSKNGQTIAVNYTVGSVCVPTTTCADVAPTKCEGQTFEIDNSGCGSLTCTGTRPCDFKWKEVAPGR